MNPTTRATTEPEPAAPTGPSRNPDGTYSHEFLLWEARLAARATTADPPDTRPQWVIEDAPHFTATPGSWLADTLPALPTLTPAAHS
ncbi:hypothetical protein SAMN05421505_120123 [Sinosporangium album]|uniref:Uncharacterized protein n=1 Tax=Sinosporangium album TaxID=504805 RepID=A0A1G8EJA4_9ACTN|nr:hypothetical protein [Sinosporangium album]SDH69906.1 hypothetical protein SAMN05421505_120123 [Sinosporangium album]